VYAGQHMADDKQLKDYHVPAVRAAHQALCRVLQLHTWHVSGEA